MATNDIETETRVGQIGRLIKNTQAYFIGNFLNRLGAFLLLPLYTRYLTPTQYGALELVITSVALAKVFLGMNLGHAILRFHFEAKDPQQRQQQVNMVILATHLWCLLVLTCLIPLGQPLSVYIAKTEQYTPLFRLGFVLLFFEVTSEVPLANLRANERSVLFVGLSGVHLLLRVGLNIYIVAALQMGVEGILIGNIIAAMIAWGSLLAVTLKRVRTSYDGANLMALLKYSWPLVAASIPGLITKNADKIILGKYASLEVLGLYALATRFKMIMEGFLIEPFNLGFGPFRFSIMRKDNAGSTFSTILTGYALGLAFCGLLIILFAPDIIQLMSVASFYDAHKIVPGLIGVAFLQGIHYVFQSGILMAKETKRLPLISTATAALNLTALYVLTPRFGAAGAVSSLILSSLLDMLLTYRFAQQVYPIPFDLTRIAKIAGAAFCVYGLSTFITDFSPWPRSLMKGALVFIVFPSLLIVLRCPTQDEIKRIYLAIRQTLKNREGGGEEKGQR